MTRSTLALVAAVCVSGCREGVPPYEPAVFEFGPQRTYSYGDDRGPVWTPDGERLIYYTDNYSELPCIRGVILTIPAEGGTAYPLLESAQRSSGRPLIRPAISPNGEFVAYYDLLGIPPDCGPSGRVEAAFLRVRRVGSSTNMLSDPSLSVARWTNVSWAPDNQRVLFEVPEGLAIWRVGDAATTLMPNTASATSASWGPNDLIAFVRGDVSRVEVIDSMGNLLTDLGIGEDPAWSPDGQSVYVVRHEQIHRVRLHDASFDVVPGTSMGKSPAISPDGSRIAFVRATHTAPINDNIWVVGLSGN